jgi:formiminoglutamase
MSDKLFIADFLDPINTSMLSQDEGYKEGQFGRQIYTYEEELPILDEAEIVLVGCREQRGSNIRFLEETEADNIRREFYCLYCWHPDVKIADIGNIKRGAALSDTYAALKTVIRELNNIGKTVVVLGGSHDCTLAQYYAFKDKNQVIDAACVDALIDLNIDSYKRSENFLMEMLTGEPNFIRHYNHIGFQSYYVNPHMLETMDKLRFDCFRLGHVKESIEEMEPVIRNADLFSFDISAIAHAFAPSNTVSPNGFSGEEACVLMRFAGLSSRARSIGIYGYEPENDEQSLTAKQIAHMLWYFIDGKSKGKKESQLEEKDSFNEYHTAFSELETTFLQSKKTGRWWMRMPDHSYIACSYNDYLLAKNNEIPERWLRAQERS